MFASLFLSPWLAPIIQAVTDLPDGVPEWIGTVVTTGILTQAIKWVSKKAGYKISGPVAIFTTAVVALGLVGADLYNGGTLVQLPAGYEGGNPFVWFQAVLASIGKITLSANAIYLFVYDRVFGSGSDDPLALAGAAMTSALPNWKVLRAFTSSGGISYAVGQIVPKGAIGSAVINGVTYNEGQLANSGYIRPWP